MIKENKLPYMIKLHMGLNNMTMKELGEKVGKSESAVSYWISGKVTPRIGVVQQLADLFSLTTDEMLYGTKKNVTNDHPLGDYFENVKYLKDQPELLALYENMIANDNYAILFDKVQKLKPNELEQILRIIDTFIDETK